MFCIVKEQVCTAGASALKLSSSGALANITGVVNKVKCMFIVFA